MLFETLKMCIKSEMWCVQTKIDRSDKVVLKMNAAVTPTTINEEIGELLITLSVVIGFNLIKSAFCLDELNYLL